MTVTMGKAPIVELMEKSPSQVIFLTAPAGYGKTTAAQRLSAGFKRVAWCDCSGVTTIKEFVTVVLTALLVPGSNEGVLVQAMHEIEMASDSAVRLELFEHVWATDVADLVVFENCEELGRSQELVDALYRALIAVPASRRIVVCSRTQLPIRVGRYLAPHRVLKISEADLKLTDEESRALLSPNLPTEYVEKIVQLAQGWPVVVLLLGRLAHEDRLDAALADSRAIEFNDFFEYFLNEVLALLTDTQRRALHICAVIPDVTDLEICTLLDLQPSEVRPLISTLPMITRYDQVFFVHPLAREILLSDDFGGDVRALAAHHESHGEYSRAAQLYNRLGDRENAARCLAALPTQGLLSTANQLELAQLSITELMRYPLLAMAVFSMPSFLISPPGYARKLLSVVESLLTHMEADADPAAVAMVAFVISQACWYCGVRQPRMSLASDVRVQRALASGNPFARLLLAYVIGHPMFVEGGIDSHKQSLEILFEQAQAAGRTECAIPLAMTFAWVDRFRGERESSTEWLERALALAKEGRHPVYMLCAVASAITTSWFWGRDETDGKYDEALDDLSRQIGKRINFAEVDYDILSGELRAGDILLHWNGGIELLLMRCAHATPSERERLFATIEQMLDGATPLTQALFFIARASARPEYRLQDLREARALSGSTEATAFTAAIDALLNGKPSFLDGFVRRFAPSKDALSARATLYINLYQESVTADSQVLDLTKREAAFIAYLARTRVASTREEIQEALWPDLDEQGARDSLYSLVHRLRKRTAPANLLRSAGNAYALADNVVVDVWEIEALTKEVQRGNHVPVEVLSAAYDSVHTRSWQHLLAYEWFALTEFRMNECERTLARRLVEVAQQEHRYADAFRYLNNAIKADPCDEWANGALIETFIANGDELEAARAFRNYRHAVRNELSAEPSHEMVTLAARLGIT